MVDDDDDDDDAGESAISRRAFFPLLKRCSRQLQSVDRERERDGRKETVVAVFRNHVGNETINDVGRGFSGCASWRSLLHHCSVVRERERKK